MTTRPLILAITFTALTFSGGPPALSAVEGEGRVATAAAADAPHPSSIPTGRDDAEYTKVLRGRADEILNDLKLDDPAKAAQVRDIVIARYREIRDWDEVHGAKRKDLAKQQTDDAKAELAKLDESRKASHDAYLAKLAAAGLSPQQIDTVKDRLTYNVVKVTYNAYLELHPTLTDEQKKKIHDWLIEARELAMDEGTSNAKHAVFGKYKGRINNYLAKEGYNAKEAERLRNERARARNAAASKPAN